MNTFEIIDQLASDNLIATKKERLNVILTNQKEASKPYFEKIIHKENPKSKK